MTVAASDTRLPGLHELARLLEAHERFAVVSHVAPDGDAIGSTVALARMLRRLGKDVVVVHGEGTPEAFAYLGTEEWQRALPTDIAGRVAVAVDCAARGRLACDGAFEQALLTVNIDHHATNDLYATVNVVAAATAATCEILAELCSALGLPLDDSIAEPLYAGLRTDTLRSEGAGNIDATSSAWLARLRAALTRADTFEEEILAVDPTAHALAEIALGRLQRRGRILTTVIDLADQQRCGVAPAFDMAARTAVLNALSERAETEDADAAVLVFQRSSGEWIASLRGRAEQLDASAVAVRFGGGGHRHAAGLPVPAGAVPDEFADVLAAAVASALGG